MIEFFNHWLEKYEALWLFLILVYSAYRETQIHHMAKIEFNYDKEWNERKAARRKKHLDFEHLTTGESK